MGVNMDSPHIQDAYRIRLERVAPEENNRMLQKAQRASAVDRIVLKANREAIAEAIGDKVLTVEELAKAVDCEVYTARRQVQRLRADGILRQAGQLKNGNGRWVKAWCAA